MKKLLFTLIVTSLASTGLFAQGLSGGVKAGVNLANLTGDDVEDSDMRIAYHVGGYVNYAFSESVSLQPELLFNSVGAKTSYTDPDFGDVEETFVLNYLSVPVDLVYSFGNFNIQAGPQFGFLLSAKDKYEIDGESDDVDIKDEMKGIDFGVNLGVGANFGKLNATARYVIGLSNVIDSDDADVKNGVIQVSLGYRLFGDDK